MAQAIVDEDALPYGAIARLGSMQRRWRTVYAHTFIDHDSTLLTVHAGPRLFFRDVMTGRLIRVSNLGGQIFNSASLSANGRVLATERHGTLQLWDVPNGKALHEISLHDEARKFPCRFHLSADGSLLVTAVGGRLDCWDVQTGQQRIFIRQPREFCSLGLCLDDHCLVAGDGLALSCWDLVSGRMIWSLDGDSSRQEPILLPGRKRAWVSIVGENATTGLYDLKTGLKADPQPEWTDIVRWKCVSPNGNLVCVRDSYGNSLRDLAADKTIAELTDMKEPLAFTPDNRFLIGRDLNYCLQRWDITTGHTEYSELEAPAHLDVTVLTFRPDGKGLVSGSEDGGLFRLWDLSTRQPRNLLQVRESSFLHSLVVFPDGRRLMHKGKDPSLEIWDLDSGKMTLSFDTPRPFGYKRLQAQTSPDGQLLYTLFPTWEKGAPSFGLQVWDLTSGDLKLERAEPSLGGSLMFSPDATLFASATTGIHDTATGQLRAGISAAGVVQRLAFSPDQTRLAAVLASTDGTGGVMLFEVGTGWRIMTLPAGTTGAIAFAPDSRRLVVATNGSIQVWDSFTGREIKHWSVGTEVQDIGESLLTATSLAVSPDGKFIASGHDDGTILLWPMPPLPADEPVALADIESLWMNLAAADAKLGWMNLSKLSVAGEKTLAILTARLRPFSPPPDERVKALLRDLTDARFARREAAVHELTGFNDVIAATLKSALAASKSAEEAQRLRQLLETPFALRDPDRIRRWRAVAILEQIHSPAAQKLLELIADGPAGTTEAEAAKSALRRLERK